MSNAQNEIVTKPAKDEMGARRVRDEMPPDRHGRSTIIGLSIFFATFIFYLILVWFAASPRWAWPLRLAAGLACGFMVAMNFVVGHDACHGSLTPHKWLNHLVGRLALCPSLHPYTSWEWSHNGLHHGMTNVRGADVVFVPKSKSEFDAMPWWRRLMYHAYRHPLGLGLYYFCTIWLPYEIFPVGKRLPPGRRRRMLRFDWPLVVGFLALWVGTVVVRSWHGSVAAGLLFSVIIPLMVFHVLMGTVSYMHHTHPKVPWYANPAEHSYLRSQVLSTVHVEFPWIVEILLCNILQHTAHHADAAIPLYNLIASQKSLEQVFEQEIVHERWNLRDFLRTTRTCRLFDYENHCWMD